MIWEDPPASHRRGRIEWVGAFVSDLREHPGKWARVVSATGKDTHGSGIRQNLTRAGCEVKGSQVGVPGGLWRLWARWPDA